MLVVEDDFVIAIELASILSDAGGQVVGPARTLRAALISAEDRTLSAAILDIRLGNDTVAPVAHKLAARRIPFLFYTGQSRIDPLRTEWPDCNILAKPALPNAIVKAVATLLDRRSSSSALR